jgi:hypothetical protein
MMRLTRTDGLFALNRPSVLPQRMMRFEERKNTSRNVPALRRKEYLYPQIPSNKQ